MADLTASRVSQERLRKIRLFQEDAYLSLDCAEGVAEIVEADRAGDRRRRGLGGAAAGRGTGAGECRGRLECPGAPARAFQA